MSFKTRLQQADLPILFRNLLPLLIMTGAGLISTIIVATQLSPCIAYDPYTVCRSFAILNAILMAISLLVLFTGVLSSIGYLIRWYYYHHEMFLSHFNTSLRQGILLSITTVVTLGMLVSNTFKWWLLALILIFILIVEFSFARRTTQLRKY